MIRTKQNDEPKLRHRNVAHFWTDKQVIRFFRKNFDKKDYKNLRSIYLALCEIDSDFGEGVQIRSLEKTIMTYSGLGKNTIPKYMALLEQFKLVQRKQERGEQGFGSMILCMYKWDQEYHPKLIKSVSTRNSVNTKQGDYKNNIYNNIYINKKNKNIINKNINNKLTPSSTGVDESDIESGLIDETTKLSHSLAKKFCDYFLKPIHGMRKTSGSIWWSTVASIKKLLVEDGRTATEIEEAIDWIRKHHGEPYVPNIPTANKFRYKFNSIRLAMNRNSSDMNGDDPIKLLKEYFEAESGDWIYTCFNPLKEYLGDLSQSDKVKLANKLIEFDKYFLGKQERPMDKYFVEENEYINAEDYWEDLKRWEMIPDSHQLIKDYIKWLEMQSWIDSASINILSPTNTIFKKFLKFEQESIGNINIFTGEYL